MGLTLLPYQQRAADEVLTCGASRPLLVSPTGTGKTVTGVHIAGQLQAPLWLAHRKELVEQAQRTAKVMGVTLRTMTVQGLVASGERPTADVLFVDEAHHLMADEWSKIADAYPRIIGLTATPELADGTGLGAIFNHITIATTVREAVTMGRLVPCRVIAPAKPLRAGQIAQDPLVAYKRHAAGRKAVLFTPNVASAMQYAAEFTAGGVKAAYVHAGMDAKTRNRVFEDYAAGRYQVLSNVSVATEGWDDPPTSCVIIARGCGTPGLFIQMVGRGLRASPGKTDCVVLDLRGVSHAHGDPLEDRIYSLEGRGIRRKAETVDQRYCAVCGACWTGVVCSDCGNVIEPAAPPRVVNAKLEQRIYIPNASDDKKAAKLAALIAEGRIKGWKPNAALVRYKVCFGAYPTSAMIAKAKSR